MNNYVIVRTENAGVFAGILSVDGTRVAEQVATLTDARRLWRWEGAASLSELAVKGTSAPGECKFPIAVPTITLTEVIEIIETTEAAEKSIRDVPEWTAH